MSNQQSSSFKSFSSVSYSSSGSINGQQVSGSRHAQQTYSDNSGTTVKSASQKYGEPATREERRFDSEGRQTISSTSGADTSRRIEDVDEEQRKRDEEYDERIEEEYAKREGGA